MSFSIGTHHCGGELKSLALFGEAKPCEHSAQDGDMMATCPFHKKESKEDEKNCCTDEQFVVEGIDIDTPVNPFHVNLTPDWEFSIPTLGNTIKACGANQANDTKYLNYKPPLLKLDIPVLIQSFLI